MQFDEERLEKNAELCQKSDFWPNLQKNCGCHGNVKINWQNVNIIKTSARDEWTATELFNPLQ